MPSRFTPQSHIGTDGRYYVIDTARMFPPEEPKFSGANLFRLLRPELVKKFAPPLSADAFSGFQVWPGFLLSPVFFCSYVISEFVCLFLLDGQVRQKV